MVFPGNQTSLATSCYPVYPAEKRQFIGSGKWLFVPEHLQGPLCSRASDPTLVATAFIPVDCRQTTAKASSTSSMGNGTP